MDFWKLIIIVLSAIKLGATLNTAWDMESDTEGAKKMLSAFLAFGVIMFLYYKAGVLNIF